MLPLRDVMPSRTTPYVTIALIVGNVLMFLLLPRSGSAARDDLISVWGVTPSAFHLRSVATAMFLHAGVLHLSGNMLFLWIFGDNVEDRLGHGRFLLFYALCGLAAALLQVLGEAGSPVPMTGANGAVAGVLGAYIVLFPESRVLTFAWVTFVEVPAAVLLGAWFVVQLLIGLDALVVVAPEDMGSVGFWAHAGGAAAGAALVLLLRRPERMRAEWWDMLT